MHVKKKYLLPAAVFILVSVLLSGLYVTMQREVFLQNKKRYEAIAVNQSSIIRSQFDTVLDRTYILSTLIASDDGDTAFFNRIAERIYQETLSCTGVQLKNIAVAPGGVVEQVYPLTGNEGLLNFDFMDSSKEGNAEAVEAYRKGSLVITPPFNLVQGGVGMAGRLPVFLTENGNSRFWGLVTVTMDFEDLMKNINLDALKGLDADYRLWYEDGSKGPVVLQESSDPVNRPVSYTFSVQNLTWHLDVSPRNGWIDYPQLAVAIAAILGVALLLAIQMLDKSRIKEINEKLERLAHLDALTSCYSRQYVNTVLVNQCSGLWNNPNAAYSLAIIDIDYFKSINDTYGHEIGDRAIIAIARLLMDNSKPEDGDCVIRHGGDEFIVLFNDVTKERFKNKLDAIVTGAREIHFPDYPDLKLSVSVGGEYYSDKERSLYYDMIRRADLNLYQAKENGRNQFIFN